MANLIRNIRAEHDGRRGSIHWEIGVHRFHVWYDTTTNEPEDTVYKNSIAKQGPPGAQSWKVTPTRRLTREGSKVTAKMFAEVLAVVQRDDLLAKAKATHKEAMLKQWHEQELQRERTDLEQEALAAFRQGDFAKIEVLHLAYCELLTKLADAMAANNAKEGNSA